MQNIEICNRKYSIRRIPLRLIVNREPCDVRIDYARCDILIGDPDGTTRQHLMECVAEAIADVAFYEYEQAGFIADDSAEAASCPIPLPPASSRPKVKRRRTKKREKLQ